MSCKIWTRRVLTASFIFASALLSFSANAQEPDKDNKLKSVWDGVYTAEQAQRGHNSYNESCAGCHKEDLSGYRDVLKGPSFMDHWREDRLESLFKTVSTTMPRGAPGTLREPTYLDIVAFLLQTNGFPAGSSELTAGALPSIQVESKTGKVEMPAGALVDVTGCLKPGASASVWTLTLATEPERTRDPNESTAEKLKALAAKPLGTAKFTLMDAAAYRPDAQKDHRVEAKGFFIKNAGENGINLTSLQTVDAACDHTP